MTIFASSEGHRNIVSSKKIIIHKANSPSLEKKSKGKPSGLKNPWPNLYFAFSFLLGFLFGGAMMFFTYDFFFNSQTEASKAEFEELHEGQSILTIESLFASAELKGLQVRHTTVDDSISLASFLYDLDLKTPDVRKIVGEFARKGLHSLDIGDRVTYFFEDDYVDKTESIVFEPYQDKRHWYQLDLSSGIQTDKYLRQIEVRERELACVLTRSMMVQAVFDCGVPVNLIEEIVEILKWDIDFYHLNAGDKFKVIYVEESVDGQVIGVQSVEAIHFFHDNEVSEVYRYPTNQSELYLSEKGRTLDKKFLKSPIPFGRISSRFDPKRVHPVLGTIKPHGGTDYAAPEGTPILSVADGIVSRISTTRYGGNTLVIKHDDVYTTKYLHISEYADGLKVGQSVSQGQTVAFVGQTGENITGPHVCFRFLVRGEEKDHLKLNLPVSGTKIDSRSYTNFQSRKDSLHLRLENIPW